MSTAPGDASPRRRWLPGAIMALAVAALGAPILVGKSLCQRDVIRFHYPLKLLVRERLLAGELPLWNARSGLGRPLLGMIQPAALYPGDLLLALPAPLCLDLYFTLHLLVLALGVRAWLRRLDLDPTAAAFGGAVAALSGYVASALGRNCAYVVGAAWVPWALEAAARALAPATKRALAGAVARLGLFLALALLGGDPQAVFFAALLGGAQALSAPGRRRVAQAFAVLAAGGLLAALIAAPQLLAGLEAAGVGRAGGVSVGDARHFALHPSRLLELAWPGAFGTPTGDRWFVSTLYDEGEGAYQEPFAAGLYLGLATPWLAVAALARGRRRIDLLLALCALFFLGVALGPHLPLWEPFFRFVPGAHQFRYPEKYLFVVTLCAAALSARGLDAVAAAPRRATVVATSLVALLAAGALAAGPRLAHALVPQLGETDGAALGALLAGRARVALAIGLCTAAPIALAAAGRLSPARLRVALALVVPLELCAASAELVGWTDSAVYRTRSPILDDLARASGGDPLARLYRPADLDLTGGRDPSLLNRLTLLPDCGLEDGLTQLDTYEPYHPPREELLWKKVRARPLRLLQLTATRFALLGDGQVGRVVPPGLKLVVRYPDLGASLYEVEGVAPRAWLALRARPVSDATEAVAAVAAPAFVPGEDLVVEGGEARRTDGRCTIERYAPERVVARCRASAPGYFVLSDEHLPGWSATVDGAPAPILPGNVLLRAVPVPAGDSRIELGYRPRGLDAGFGAAALGLALALALLVAARRRTTPTAPAP